jgi:hypothetical protein
MRSAQKSIMYILPPLFAFTSHLTKIHNKSTEAGVLPSTCLLAKGGDDIETQFRRLGSFTASEESAMTRPSGVDNSYGVWQKKN